MSWFDVIKARAKLKPEIIKESIKKIVDRQGYFQFLNDKEEFIQNYSDAYQKIMDKYMYNSKEAQNLRAQLRSAKVKLSGHITPQINNYAKGMYKHNITQNNIEGEKFRMSGLYMFIKRGGSIFFKDRNEYEKFVDKFIKK